VGTEKFGTRCELKTINSFKFVHARSSEIIRQTAILDAGARSNRKRAASTRTPVSRTHCAPKDDAHDYRYFREPDLPPLRLDAAFIAVQREGCASCRSLCANAGQSSA